jgi:dUTP pyrophosphatase
LTDELRKKFAGEQLTNWESMEEMGYWAMDPGTGFLFRTGFAQAIAPDYACFFWDRSGMGGKEVHRFAGVIDEDYRGEWLVKLFNHSDDTVYVNAGDKIVQGVYQLRTEAIFPVIDVLPPSVRGEGGFGSTGK